jgi:hypothetical protein
VQSHFRVEASVVCFADQFPNGVQPQRRFPRQQVDFAAGAAGIEATKTQPPHSGNSVAVQAKPQMVRVVPL